MIRISNSEELREGCTDRVITMTGNPDSVALAQYLINMRYVLIFCIISILGHVPVIDSRGRKDLIQMQYYVLLVIR